MENTKPIVITVQVSIHAPIALVWNLWTTPNHVMQWNSASEDWHTPMAENELVVGGNFLYQMAAKDGSFAFDFTGTYTQVMEHDVIQYVLGDGRKVMISFISDGDSTQVVETFEAENENPVDMQRQGWQAILDNFKLYAEGYQ